MDFLRWARKQWDRVGAVAAALAGALAVFAGWFGASAETNPAGQIPYVISGGIFGVLLLGVAATLWLSADLRDEWRKLDRVERRLASVESSPPVTSSATTGRGEPSGQNGRPEHHRTSAVRSTAT